jgi:hypothetical protein
MNFLTKKNVILEELKVEPADKKIKRYKSNWLRCVTRMNNNRMPKIVLNCRPVGRRRLGKTFEDTNRRYRKITITA